MVDNGGVAWDKDVSLSAISDSIKNEWGGGGGGEICRSSTCAFKFLSQKCGVQAPSLRSTCEECRDYQVFNKDLNCFKKTLFIQPFSTSDCLYTCTCHTKNPVLNCLLSNSNKLLPSQIGLPSLKNTSSSICHVMGKIVAIFKQF